MPLLALKQYFYDPMTLLCLRMLVLVCEQAIAGKRQELHKYSMVKLSEFGFPHLSFYLSYLCIEGNANIKYGGGR